jgi:hypothetical protein
MGYALEKIPQKKTHSWQMLAKLKKRKPRFLTDYRYQE